MTRKVKYSYLFKVKLVTQYVKGLRTIQSLCNEHDLHVGLLRKWVCQYRQTGFKGLKERGYTFYDPLFKREVLEVIQEEGLSLKSACLRFNIPSESMIIDWRRKVEREGWTGLLPKKKGRPSMKESAKKSTKKSDKPLTREEELQRENEYLRAEVAFLKKLRALAQSDKKQKPSKG